MIEDLKALANQVREISLYQANAVAAIIVKMADALEALAAREPQCAAIKPLVWEPIDTAPRGGDWFIARTKKGTARVVHYADEYDRFPISHDSEIWETPPIEWVSLSRVLSAITLHSEAEVRAEAPAAGMREATGVYIASKAKYGHEWLAMRDAGYPVISTWIEESGEGQTLDWPDLWTRCISEASKAAVLVLVCRDGDTLKGAWAEVGAALANGRRVLAVGIEAFSIRHHPLVTLCENEGEAFSAAAILAAIPLTPTAADDMATPETGSNEVTK